MVSYMDRLKKILAILLIIWVSLFIIGNIIIFFKLFYGHDFVYYLILTMYYSWVILIIPIVFVFGLHWRNRRIKKISEMSDDEIIEYYQNRILLK